jgi:hypothetical protein
VPLSPELLELHAATKAISEETSEERRGVRTRRG